MRADFGARSVTGAGKVTLVGALAGIVTVAGLGQGLEQVWGKGGENGQRRLMHVLYY